MFNLQCVAIATFSSNEFIFVLIQAIHDLGIANQKLHLNNTLRKAFSKFMYFFFRHDCFAK